jgi:hypothetical protein
MTGLCSCISAWFEATFRHLPAESEDIRECRRQDGRWSAEIPTGRFRKLGGIETDVTFVALGLNTILTLNGYGAETMKNAVFWDVTTCLL